MSVSLNFDSASGAVFGSSGNAASPHFTGITLHMVVLGTDQVAQLDQSKRFAFNCPLQARRGPNDSWLPPLKSFGPPKGPLAGVPYYGCLQRPSSGLCRIGGDVGLGPGAQISDLRPRVRFPTSPPNSQYATCAFFQAPQNDGLSKTLRVASKPHPEKPSSLITHMWPSTAAWSGRIAHFSHVYN